MEFLFYCGKKLRCAELINFSLHLTLKSMMNRVIHKKRYFTLALIAINILIYFIISSKSKTYANMAASYIGFFHYNLFWTPLTYMFLHGSSSHLLFNMLTLFIFGSQLEERMGSFHFIMYYLLTGICAGLFSILLYGFGGIGVRIVGASGAIYALLLGFAVYYPWAKIYIMGIIPVPAPYLILIYAAWDIFSHISGRTGIAHLTHLSGFLFGFLYFILFLKINPWKIFVAFRRSRRR